MKILIYAVNYSPEFTGAGRYTGEAGAFLAASGDEVVVVTAQPHYPGWSLRNDQKNRYGVERLPNQIIFRCPIYLPKRVSGFNRLAVPLTFALTSIIPLVHNALKYKPDVIFCVEPTLFCAPLAVLVGQISKSKTMLYIQDLEVDAAFSMDHLQGRFLKSFAFWLESLILRRFVQIVTISSRMKAQIVAKGVKESVVSIIRNWVNVEHIQLGRSCPSLRSDLNIPAHSKIVLYSGNIGPKQALNILLDAAASLEQDDRFVFVIAGEGPNAANLILRNLSNVRFLPLQLESDFPDFLATADVHILPQAVNIGDLVLPSKLAALLASGKPLIVQAMRGTELATFLDGTAAIIEPGQAYSIEFLLDTGTYEKIGWRERRLALSDTLSDKIALPQLREVIHSAAQRR